MNGLILGHSLLTKIENEYARHAEVEAEMCAHFGLRLLRALAPLTVKAEDEYV